MKEKEMRFKRVFLINSTRSGYYGPLRPHLGLGYIAETLYQKGITYDICDMLFGYSDKQLIKRIKDFSPDVIGFNIYTFHYFHTYDFIKKIKSFFPDIPFIAGGPHVTTFETDLMTECREIDFAVIREGEDIIIELCSGKDLDDIEGLIYRKNGVVIKNKGRDFIRDLDRLPFPRYEKFELGRYIPEIPILSSRGCPFNCTFCQVDSIVGRTFRKRSPENIIVELKYWYDRGYRRFNFMDDNFTMDRDRVHRLCDLIKTGGFSSLFMRCAGIRCDKVDEKLLSRMKEAGFRTVSFGVEGGNDKILRTIRKSEKISTIDKTIKIACDLNYDVNLFFLIGSPGETREDVNDSFRLALKHPVFRVNFYNIIPYPKTEIYNWVREKGYFLKEPTEYLNSLTANDLTPVFITDEMTTEEKIGALKEARKIERKVLQNAVLRRLERFKIRHLAAKIFAYLLSRKATETIIFKNTAVRRIFESARYKYHKLNS